MAKIRNLRMDNAKAILIILVVIGHFLLPIEGRTRVCTNFFYVIYTFHMVAFTFLSGLFAQGIYKEKEGRKVFNWRQWFKILWLYILYEFITFFSEIPAYGRTTELPDLLRENGAPWYLMALMLWYLLIPAFSTVKGKYLCLNSDDKYISSNKEDSYLSVHSIDEGIDFSKGLYIPLSVMTWFAVFILSLIAGYIPCLDDLLSLDRVTAFAPSFFAGYFIGPKKMEIFLRGHGYISDRGHDVFTDVRSRRSTSFRTYNKWIIFKWLIVAIGLISVVIVALFMADRFMPYHNTVYGVWYRKLGYNELAVAYPDAVYISPWILRLMWNIMAGSMTVLLLQLMPYREIPVLTEMGQKTLQIYVLHRPIRDIMLAIGVITSVDPANMLQLTYLVLLAIVLSVLLASDIFTALFKALLYPFRRK